MSGLRDGADVQIQFGQSADEGEHLLWHIEDAGGKQTPFDIIVVVGGLLPLLYQTEDADGEYEVIQSGITGADIGVMHVGAMLLWAVYSNGLIGSQSCLSVVESSWEINSQESSAINSWA